MLANGEVANDLLANVTGGGAMIGLLDVLGTIPGGGGFSIKIEPQGGQAASGGRGERCRAFPARDGCDPDMQIRPVCGSMGTSRGRSGCSHLAGTAVIDDVVVHNSPVLGKLLQAITLYGLVDALRGPGMTFSRIVAPYRYDGADLILNDARAANPSLGLTAQGRIGLVIGAGLDQRDDCAGVFLQFDAGTTAAGGQAVQPGEGWRACSPRGSGWMGRSTIPSLSLNPISALTPGFLRDIFSIFDKPAATPGPPAKSP